MSMSKQRIPATDGIVQFESGDNVKRHDGQRVLLSYDEHRVHLMLSFEMRQEDGPPMIVSVGVPEVDVLELQRRHEEALTSEDGWMADGRVMAGEFTGKSLVQFSVGVDEELTRGEYVELSVRMNEVEPLVVLAQEHGGEYVNVAVPKRALLSFIRRRGIPFDER